MAPEGGPPFLVLGTDKMVVVVLVDILLIINKMLKIWAHWQGRTFLLNSQIFYINLCDVRHIFNLTFPYDYGIIVVMKKTFCEIRHTDMSDLCKSFLHRLLRKDAFSS